MRRHWLTVFLLAALVLLVAWLRRGSEREFDAPAPVADETEPCADAELLSPTGRESVPELPVEPATRAPRPEQTAAHPDVSANSGVPLEKREGAELEILVLIDELPASHIAVEMVPLDAETDDASNASEPPTTQLRTGVTASDGTVRFRGLSAASYDVHVTLPSGARVTRTSDGFDSLPFQRIVFNFGSASVFGTVFDDDGAPAVGEIVLIICEPRKGSFDWKAELKTDERGGYSLSGLSPGFVQLVSRDSAIIRTTAGRRARIELGLGEQRRVDLGSPYPLARWSGTVRLPDGRALAQAMTMWVYEKSRGWRIEFVCDASGAFDFELPRGEYQIFTYGRPQPIELGVLDVTSTRIESDITLPLPIVFGTANWSDDPSPVERRQVVFEPRSGDSSTLVNIENGTFCAFALPAGEYLVYVYKTKLLGHPPEGFELRVDPLATIELELSLVR